MNIALRKPMTLSEFLAWEERQGPRYEFDGVGPVAMTGGSDAHEAIGGRLRALLDAGLADKPCRYRGPTMKIEVAGRIRYPDAFVYCGSLDRKETVVRDPVVVFEVISPGTSRVDRIVKLREYQATPSVQRYVILEQDSVSAMVITRDGENWLVSVLTGGDVLAMPEIGLEFPLAEIYRGVDLPPEEDDDGR